MLWPRSIAVIGASADTRTLRGRILEYLLQRRYSGELFLVSPTQSEIRGHRTYSSIGEVPGPVDLVLIAARASATPGILQECAQAGAAFAICYSSGFAEEGAEGARLQQQLAELARMSPGNVSFSVNREIGRRNFFSLVEIWKDANAYQAFLNSDRTQALLARTEPLLEAPLDVRPGTLVE